MATEVTPGASKAHSAATPEFISAYTVGKSIPPQMRLPKLADRPQWGIVLCSNDDATRANQLRSWDAKPRAPCGQPSYRKLSDPSGRLIRGARRNFGSASEMRCSAREDHSSELTIGFGFGRTHPSSPSRQYWFPSQIHPHEDHQPVIAPHPSGTQGASRCSWHDSEQLHGYERTPPVLWAGGFGARFGVGEPLCAPRGQRPFDLWGRVDGTYARPPLRAVRVLGNTRGTRTPASKSCASKCRKGKRFGLGQNVIDGAFCSSRGHGPAPDSSVAGPPF